MAAASARMIESLISRPKQFQLFQPMGGVRASSESPARQAPGKMPARARKRTGPGIFIDGLPIHRHGHFFAKPVRIMDLFMMRSVFVNELRDFHVVAAI